MRHKQIAVFSKSFKGLPNGWKRIPKVTFVVGDNSSGKTSLLDLIAILDSTEFNFSNEVFGVVDGIDEPSEVITRFGTHDSVTVGYLGSNDDDEGRQAFSGKIVTFRRDKNNLRIEAVTMIQGRSAYRIKLNGSIFSAKKFEIEEENDALEEAKKLAESAHFDNGTGYTQVLTLSSRKQPAFPEWFQATIHAAMYLTEKQVGRKRFSNVFSSFEGAPFSVLRYGPIRGETKALYPDSGTKDFDASGSHFPSRLREIGQKNKNLMDPINEFGEASSLFDSVRTETLKGAGTAKAFSIVYQKFGVDFHGNELGYGLGQIIPIVTDLLASDQGRTFLIQQPEVHLHPRAQAAFGSLLAKVAQSDCGLVIETHSDFIIDRFRLELASSDQEIDAQILFFEKPEAAERPECSSIPINKDGEIIDAPSNYRNFFINEEIEIFKKL